MVYGLQLFPIEPSEKAVDPSDGETEPSEGALFLSAEAQDELAEGIL